MGKLLGNLSFAAFIALTPFILGIVLVIGILAQPLVWLDDRFHLWSPDPNKIQIDIVGLEWSGQTDRVLTVRVKNSTNDPYRQFNFSCDSDIWGSSPKFADQSGLMPNQSDVRSYMVSGSQRSAYIELKNCELTHVEKGKPTESRLRDGRWGDRVDPSYVARTGYYPVTDRMTDTGDRMCWDWYC